MDKLLIFLAVFPLLLSQVGCHKNTVVIYVENAGQYTRDKKIKVFLDDSLVVNQTFTCTGIRPNNAMFEFYERPGSHHLKVATGDLVKEDSFDLDGNIYFHISYTEFFSMNNDTVRSINILKTRKDLVPQ